MIPDRRIFSSSHAFCERDRELDRIINAAFNGNSLVISGPHGIGKTELLRQAFDELFYSENKVPIYFEFRSGEDTASGARRFAHELLTQALAFRQSDADMIRTSPSLEELAVRSSKDAALEECVKAIQAANDAEIVSVALGLPSRILSAGLQACLLLDDLHEAGEQFLRELQRQIAFGRMSFIVSSAGRATFPIPTIALEPLGIVAASEMVGSIAEDLGVTVVDATRELIALQLEGRPGAIRDLLLDAAGEDRSLSTFRSVESVYFDSILDGRLSRESPGTARTAADIGELRSRSAKKGSTTSSVKAAMLVHLVERSRKLLDAYYHSRSAIGVRQLLEDLNGQSVSTAAVGYRLFKEAIKGLDDEAAVEKLSSSDDMVVLPRIIYSADAVEIYPSLAEFSDPGRSAVGVTEDGEVWAIAEIDSKLEADAAKAEFWCDRLEMAAASAGSGRVHIWLIAPEGFDEDALTFLGDRGAFGSSRKQIELLRQLLNTRPDEHGTTYELAVPMGEEGELTATRTLKDIATRHQIPAKATMQIKTALVEALINAAEHSLSPDRRIELRFVVGASEIRISVENRGLRLTDRMPGNDPEQDQRRGWGLELMRKMMDDVRLEPTDDGTKLLMIKRFGPTAS